MRVFDGASGAKVRTRDFANLSNAKSVSREQRAVLVSLEKASRYGAPLSASTVYETLPPAPLAPSKAAISPSTPVRALVIPANERRAQVPPFVALN